MMLQVKFAKRIIGFFAVILFLSILTQPSQLMGEELTPQRTGILVISQDKFVISKNMFNELTISGSIENYKRGDEIFLIIEKPNKTFEELVLYGTKDGQFITITYIRQNADIGTYKIIAHYKDLVIGPAYFTVTDEETSFNKENEKITPWIKNIARWWSKGTTSDIEFANSLEWLVRNKIIIGFVSYDVTYSPKDKLNVIIPNWIRDSAERWSYNKMSDSDFTNTIGFMIHEKIIDIPEAKIDFSFYDPILDISDGINTNPFGVQVTEGKIPQKIGNVELVEQSGLIPFFRGALTGNWLLFHDKSHLTLDGTGHVLIRWEVEKWLRQGPISPPIIEGDIWYLGEENVEFEPEIEGWRNKYYRLNGTAYIENTEQLGGTYNLAISVVDKITADKRIHHKISNAWTLGVKRIN